MCNVMYVTCCVLCNMWRVLLVVCCVLCDMCCMLLIMCWMLCCVIFVVCCVIFVVCCVLCAVCYVLSAMCCVICVLWYVLCYVCSYAISALLCHTVMLTYLRILQTPCVGHNTLPIVSFQLRQLGTQKRVWFKVTPPFGQNRTRKVRNSHSLLWIW